MRIKRLPITLPPGSGDSLQTRIRSCIRLTIESGRLRAGEALPSSRDLAASLGVSRNTVLNAIASLKAEGWLETRRGAGTFVKFRPTGNVTTRCANPPPHSLTDWAQQLPRQPKVIRAAKAEIDFLPGVPDLQRFPSDEWRRSATRRLRTLRSRIGSYGPAEGDPELRSEIARYVARSRAVVCSAEDVIITSGAQQAFDLIARVLVRGGTEVAIEDPGYKVAALGFRAAGARIRGVPVDDEGLQADRLPGRARLIYVTPSHQYPLGVALSMRRRTELLSWAQSRAAFIIEDDYDSEYRHRPEPLPSLQGSDSSGRVIYVGTFSKILMPGIRLGYIVAPQWLRPVLVAAKWLTDRHSESIAQSVLADFMATGAFARHLAKMQVVYTTRHEVLLNAIKAAAIPGLRPLPSRAGLHTCIAFEGALNEQSVIRAAAAAGVGLYGLADSFWGTPYVAGLILGFGNLSAESIEDGIGRLARIMTGRQPRPVQEPAAIKARS